jgi:hypothetical protein
LYKKKIKLKLLNTLNLIIGAITIKIIKIIKIAKVVKTARIAKIIKVAKIVKIARFVKLMLQIDNMFIITEKS